VRRVLIVERSGPLRADLRGAVRAAGWDAEAAGSAEAAGALARARAFDAALVEVAGPADLATLAALREAAPRMAVVAAGADPSVDVAVEAMKRGARDFLRKPFGVSRLEATLAAALGPETGAEAPSPLLTEDRGMRALLRQAEAAAATEATVQIVGESGTGKDLLARRIHQRSPRRAGPYVAVNCAALPESLAESELFGHEQGAFTGATEARPGQFAQARGGTLLLDEVSELAPSLQPKLLRVLQEREVMPVGAVATEPVDVRVVATSQRDLGDEVARGRFREDLYFRLDVIVLHVPPLRERPGDVPLLARHFLARAAEAHGTEPPRLGAEVMRALCRHPFRGNVRELENLMRRAAVWFPGRDVDPERLLASGPRRGNGSAAGTTGLHTFNLREIERQVIARSLAETGGNRTHASALLGISVRTLRNKIKAYSL